MDWTHFLQTPLLSQDFLTSLSTLKDPNTLPPKEDPIPQEPAKPQTRCPTCRHKLTLADTTCRCGLRHCLKHRLPESHACTFDHKTAGKTVLESQVIRCVADKVQERI